MNESRRLRLQTLARARKRDFTSARMTPSWEAISGRYFAVANNRGAPWIGENIPLARPAYGTLRANRR